MSGTFRSRDERLLPMRRSGPLPPVDSPSRAGTTRQGGLRLAGSPPSSAGSSLRPFGAGSSIGALDLPPGGDPFAGSRSTSASSCQGAGRPGGAASAGEADQSQAEQVVQAMLPVVQRGMASSNRAVFQTALDTIIRIERMFGKAAFDHHLETLAAALEKQSSQPGGDARVAQILQTILELCSDPTATALRQRFPQHCG